LARSEIRELLRIAMRPEVISFAGGLPAPEAFPLEAIRDATRRVLDEHGPMALQYSATEGYEPLREQIARHAFRYGIAARPSNVLITCGSQQALDLIGKLFLEPGDTVLVEDPTYLGAVQAFRAYGVEFLTVPLDHDGVRIDRLEQVLRQEKPKLLYLLPNFQNPSGVTMSELRRQEVVQLAARHGLPIVEDDPYGQLRYEGDHLTPLFVLDSELEREPQSGDPVRGAHVVYTSTFSKLLAPGLRIGWILAPEEVIAQLTLVKQGTDLHTSTFTQMVAYETCRGGFLDRHIRVIRKLYSERRAAMLAALERHMPAQVQWTRPAGGLFLWVTLPFDVDSRGVLEVALRKGVAFVPGGAFHASGGGSYTMRLNFSYCTPERIDEGIERLAEAVRECLVQSSFHSLARDPGAADPPEGGIEVKS
jgi:2-aminoadipate transaminase